MLLLGISNKKNIEMKEVYIKQEDEYQIYIDVDGTKKMKRILKPAVKVNKPIIQEKQEEPTRLDDSFFIYYIIFIIVAIIMVLKAD
ncbi:MAG: hypothetical protein Ta2D_10760 [Rickettsiales bacterium]|nr:MAG: hypothetical protein Ta2D_10760 [Rickettsiales bacterium]